MLHGFELDQQSIPERRDAGGAERVLASTDRVWFKVKPSDRRGTVTELRGDDLPEWVLPIRGSWWIGAAGRRQGDSAQRDFYAVLEKECTTGKTVSSLHLLEQPSRGIVRRRPHGSARRISPTRVG